MILLETRNWNEYFTFTQTFEQIFSLTNAEVGLTLWTVVFGFSPQYAAAAISCVPTKVARESWSVTRLEKHSFNSLKVNVSLHLAQRALYVMVLQSIKYNTKYVPWDSDQTDPAARV